MKTTLCIASLLSLSNGAHLRATNSLVSSTTTTTAQGGHSVFPGSTRFVNKNPVCVEDTATTMDGISTVTLQPWQKRLGVQCCEAGVWTGDETKDYPSWKVSRPGCLKEKTYAEADAHCKSVDKQLCQISQLTNDNAKGKGCVFDRMFVWTQTVCTVQPLLAATKTDDSTSATDTDDADSQSTAAIPPGNDLLTKTVDAIADTTSTRIKSLETKMEKMTTALYIETEDRLDTAETTIQELKTSKSKAETANAALKTELSLLKSAVSGIEKGEPGKDGPKGDQGEPGAPGAAGPVGAVGPPGKDGANGEKGADGVASESLKQTVAALRLEHDECSSNPCQNGATCIDGNSAYTCNCEPGYDGVNCENNIDECADQTCSYHGTCVDSINSYSCQCTDGYKGEHCEINIDECEDQTCSNQGTCVDGINSYSCQCSDGFSGHDCETQDPLAVKVIVDLQLDGSSLTIPAWGGQYSKGVVEKEFAYVENQEITLGKWTSVPPYGSGGSATVMQSSDQGQTWSAIPDVPINRGMGKCNKCCGHSYDASSYSQTLTTSCTGNDHGNQRQPKNDGRKFTPEQGKWYRFLLCGATCKCAPGYSGVFCDTKSKEEQVTCGGFQKYGSSNAYICQKDHLQGIGGESGNCKKQCEDKGPECGAYSVRENNSGCKLFKITNQGGNWGSGCGIDSNWKGFYKRDC